MNRFKQNAHEFLRERPQGEWEWMLTARHHGLPSRLLDWTESPLTALYFAVYGESQFERDSDGILWCLLPANLNQQASNRTLDTDSLPMFTDEESLSQADQFLDSYRVSRVSVVNASLPPAAGISIRTTRRIQAQRGVFTIHHSDKTPLDDIPGDTHLWRYVIPSSAKPTILKQLRRLGVTRLTIFPDLDSVALEASEELHA